MAKPVVDIPRLAKYAWIMANLSPAKLYHYRATITVVYDGDTCTAAVDLGFKVTVRGEKIRLKTTYNNWTDETVTFGLRSTDEMMILFGAYYAD